MVATGKHQDLPRFRRKQPCCLRRLNVSVAGSANHRARALGLDAANAVAHCRLHKAVAHGGFDGSGLSEVIDESHRNHSRP
jgi:hypothetical protein